MGGPFTYVAAERLGAAELHASFVRGALVIAVAAAGAFAGTLPALVYHQIAFGAPWITGYSFKAASDFQAIIAHGTFGISWPSSEALWGILFSARRGWFFFCPFLWLVPIGLRSMVKKEGWRGSFWIRHFAINTRPLLKIPRLLSTILL